MSAGRCHNKMKFIRDTGYKWVGKKTRQRCRTAIYECSVCGRQKEYVKTDMSKKKTSMCLHCASVALNVKHNLFGTRLYKIYMGMKNRCYCTTSKDYKYYGAVGIGICDEWLNDVTKFSEWAINNGYKKNLTIDRIDNNGSYTPENCRWADIFMQNCNRNFKLGVVGVRGITFEHNKFRAVITTRGKKINIGSFDKLKDAAEARNKYIDTHNLNNKYSVMSLS